MEAVELRPLTVLLTSANIFLFQYNINVSFYNFMKSWGLEPSFNPSGEQTSGDNLDWKQTAQKLNLWLIRSENQLNISADVMQTVRHWRTFPSAWTFAGLLLDISCGSLYLHGFKLDYIFVGLFSFPQCETTGVSHRSLSAAHPPLLAFLSRTICS